MKIAVLDDYAGVALDYGDWAGLGDVTVFSDTLAPGPALIERLAPFDVLCVMRERTPLPASVLRALPRLRLIVTTGPKNAAIDLDAARAQGVTVCGTASRKTTTSELTLLMMLALNRRLLPEVASLRAGGWQAGLGRDVAGLRLGLVGLGNIGAQMATLGRALGMEVAAWSMNLSDARAAECGAERYESLTALMGACDVVSVHLVHSERTHRLIGAEAFAAMKPGAVFLNTSRAGIVDTGALVDGLHAGRPAMAGVDVFDREPLPADDPLNDAALQDAGRLLLTPHLGYTTEATFRLFYRETAEAVRAFAAGAPVRVLA
ncbi:MAG: D-2-hydroxyacid dehydrogenase family protein [Rhodobacteraceae bacterium]|nr:D-2-hydroxyacid dehydrogenase family protein [Paracoccaceae bacterium]